MMISYIYLTPLLLLMAKMFGFYYSNECNNNLLTNGDFDNVTEIYRSSNNSSMENVVNWQSLNSVDFFKSRFEKTNFVGLVVAEESTPLEYLYTNLVNALDSNGRYKLNITIYTEKMNRNKIPLSLVLYDSSKVATINKYNMSKLVSDKRNIVIDTKKMNVVRKLNKWSILEFTFTAHNSNLNSILIGNCLNESSKYTYAMFDDICIERLSKSDRTLYVK